jgi:Tfp pilus assembly protein PilZ
MKEDKPKTYTELPFDFDKENVWHVFPLNDLKRHLTGRTRVCWCNPKIEFQQNKGLLIVHNSADGREFHEELVKSKRTN